MATAVDDLLRARAERGDLSSLSRRILSDPAQHDLGVRSVDVRLFEAAAMLGCSGSAMFRQVVFPASLPAIFNGLRIAHGFAWILIVVGEMTGVPTGLGSVIMDGRTLSRTDLVVTGMIVIGVCGFVTDRIIVIISNRVLQWSPQHHA